MANQEFDAAAWRDANIEDLQALAVDTGLFESPSMTKAELIDALLQTGLFRPECCGSNRDGSHSDSMPKGALVTTNHDVIRLWAHTRGAVPAFGERADATGGVLRFRFLGQNDRLQEVTWDEWFAAFDERGLSFVYEEKRDNNSLSNFFRLQDRLGG